MNAIPVDTLNETTRTEHSARIDLWEIDLTMFGGQRYFSVTNRTRRANRSPGRDDFMKYILFRVPGLTLLVREHPGREPGREIGVRGG